MSRDGSGFSTTLYRKKTFTGLYTECASLAPNKYKVNLISILIYRAFQICSTYASFHNEIERIKSFLTKNNYPMFLIDRVLKRSLDRKYNARPKRATVPKKPLIFCLPFLGHYSLQLKRNLSRLLDKAYPHIEVKFVFLTTNQIGNFFQFKDRVPTLCCSSVIYKFQCASCSASYFGKTSLHLAVRSREHLSVNKQGKPIVGSFSSVKDHINRTGHAGSLDDFNIIAKASREFDILIFESLLIARDRPSLNSQESSIPLCLF